MAIRDVNYKPTDSSDTMARQCAVIRHYEQIMTQLYEFNMKEHTIEEYKQFINKSIWFQTMEDKQ